MTIKHNIHNEPPTARCCSHHLQVAVRKLAYSVDAWGRLAANVATLAHRKLLETRMLYLERFHIETSRKVHVSDTSLIFILEDIKTGNTGQETSSRERMGSIKGKRGLLPWKRLQREKTIVASSGSTTTNYSNSYVLNFHVPFHY